jgi:RNA polymerase sigma-70 factor (ECF subfamily)
MFRDMTFTDVTRIDTAHEECASFVMDEDAFRSFYDRNARSLWGYLVRVTGDRHAADDFLQETFYRFLRAAAVYESEDHRRHALYRIATNLARDARRRSVTHPAAVWAGDDIERVPAADATAAADRATDCSRAMAHLKPRERAMLWLAYAEGATHREIAEVLGLRQASLKMLLFRARRKLVTLLGEGAGR